MIEKPLRIELRAKNNILWKAIHSDSKNVAQFCKKHGFKPNRVGMLLNLNKSPMIRNINSSTNNYWSSYAYRLSKTLLIPEEELFPIDLYKHIKNSKIAIEVSDNAILEFTNKQKLLLEYEMDLDGRIDSVMRTESVDMLLRTISIEEREIIKRKFGLKSEPQETLEEIAKDLKITRERVRQIEAKAINKLRHPRNLKMAKAI